MRVVRWLLWLFVVGCTGYALILLLAFETAPTGNTTQSHYDTLIVLGTPARLDGSPTPEMRERVDEGVREYRAGVAPRIIMTGTSAHNRIVEAQAMKNYAVQQGIPADAVLVEGKAQDTAQNLWYSHELMRANGMQSAEVISAPSHLPRSGLMLKLYTGGLSFPWHTHASHVPPELSLRQRLVTDAHDATGCLLLWLHRYPRQRFLPGTQAFRAAFPQAADTR